MCEIKADIYRKKKREKERDSQHTDKHRTLENSKQVPIITVCVCV